MMPRRSASVKDGIMRYWSWKKDVLQLLTNIREEQLKMATQVTNLNAAITSISTALGNLGSDVQNLIADLEAANENPAVDLSSQIAQLNSIGSTLAALDTKVQAALPATSTSASGGAPVSTGTGTGVTDTTATGTTTDTSAPGALGSTTSAATETNGPSGFTGTGPVSTAAEDLAASHAEASAATTKVAP